MATEPEIDQLAKKLWDYGLLHQKLEKADAIIVFGSYNPSIALRAIELYEQGLAPIVVFSGNRSDSTTAWAKTEAETMADLAIEHGLPKEVTRIEPNAKNSGENTRFSRALLEKEGIKTKKIIVVQKPYAERRAYATVRKQWPEVEVRVTSPQVSYEQYMDETPKDKNGSIATMVGDVQRIKVYGANGFQIPQEIPANVWKAYEGLVELGFSKWLV
ncbi:MAG TPA: YdcF family protein [Candidatus Saccharimonadales bacterium]|nr:YdcF family protein [Candidatus Saccharimonadales bacterium]